MSCPAQDFLLPARRDDEKDPHTGKELRVGQDTRLNQVGEGANEKGNARIGGVPWTEGEVP